MMNMEVYKTIHKARETEPLYELTLTNVQKCTPTFAYLLYRAKELYREKCGEEPKAVIMSGFCAHRLSLDMESKGLTPEGDLIPELEVLRPFAYKYAERDQQPFRVFVISGMGCYIDTLLPHNEFYLLSKEEHEELFSEAHRTATNLKLNECNIYPKAGKPIYNCPCARAYVPE